MTDGPFDTVDAYVASQPGPVRERLEAIRALLRNLLPDAQETIAYAIPTFRLNGKNLVHFAAFKHHIGLYPTPNGVEAFQAELEPYKSGKASARFLHSEALPLELIERIVLFRARNPKKSQAIT